MNTKNGIQVEVGQKWRDCDKRMYGRIRTIAAIFPNEGKVKWAESPYKVSVKRMYKHSTGFELIT